MAKRPFHNQRRDAYAAVQGIGGQIIEDPAVFRVYAPRGMVWIATNRHAHELSRFDRREAYLAMRDLVRQRVQRG